ncbi:MAG TPA: hypothetical protein PLP24_09145 [Acetivibrio thermocellus]|nr:hypothetical protein [Acetivibrio thermocellus]
MKLTEKHFIVGSSKNGYIFSFIIILALLTTFTACSENSAVNVETESSSKSSKKIYLYGEKHGVKKIMDKEFELWHEYYNNKNMRHLFVELPYYTAEFLNIWMKSDSDEILDELYNDWIGTALYNPYTKEFYKKIKSNCPETIFHGTDVGHQYDTTGQRFLKYLEENNLKDSEKYRLAHEAVKQGKYYYENSDDVYRENKMVENFIREYDALNGECMMGIYGNAHTSLDAMDFTDSVPCMANQLKDIYKDIIYSEDLSWLAMNPFERIVYWLFEKK